MAKKTYLVKMKDGRIGLGHAYRKNGIKLLEVTGNGFFLDSVGPAQIVYSIPSDDIDELMKAAGRWHWVGENE